jgi:anti-sigma factor RsiW
MTDRNFNTNPHVDELLSGYLDGELTQQDRQRVENHLDDCEPCRSNLNDLEALRFRMGKARLSPAGPDEWREIMKDETVRLTRGIGWLLFLGALLILFGVGVFEFLSDSGTELIWKILVSALYLGLGALFVSVLRQRLIERRTDKYKDVEI